MKGITGVIIGAVIVIVVIVGVVNYRDHQKPDHSGSLFIGVTDATQSIQDVNDINISIKKVEIYSAAKGWETVSSNTKSYKLLSLNQSGKTELYARADVAANTYDKVRVTLGDTVVNTKSRGDLKATLPSSYVVLNTNLMVKEGQTSNIKLDVLASKSLHMTSDKGYVFAPVIASESRSNATVQASDESNVSVSGGTVDAMTSTGVDLDGMSKTNFNLVTDSSLKVSSSTSGTIQFLLGGKTYTQSSESMNGSDNSNSTNNSMNGSGSSNGAMNLNDSGSLNVNTQGGLKVTQ